MKDLLDLYRHLESWDRAQTTIASENERDESLTSATSLPQLKSKLFSMSESASAERKKGPVYFFPSHPFYDETSSWNERCDIVYAISTRLFRPSRSCLLGQKYHPTSTSSGPGASPVAQCGF